MTIRCTVWGEAIHEKESALVASIYPDGMHHTIAEALRRDPQIDAVTTTLHDRDQGCSAELLDRTDVLVWWGHEAHESLQDVNVERIAQHVWAGMGLIVLHSAHFSRIFKLLMGTPCTLKWREAGERERIWVVNPAHPIAAGLPEHFELEMEEMYGEPFAVPEPLETVFISWFQGGEVFRSGLTFQRGAGKVFYFQPGHEAYPTYHNAYVQQILRNAVRWSARPDYRWTTVTDAANVPVARGPMLAISDRQDGEMTNRDRHLQMLAIAIEEAKIGLHEGGIPIGAALFHNDGRLLGKGRNRRVQENDPSVHGETDAFRKAGRQSSYVDTTMATTMAPCWYCSGLIVQFGIGTVVVGESRTFRGGIDWLRERGIQVIDLDSDACVEMHGTFINANPTLWNEDIGK